MLGLGVKKDVPTAAEYFQKAVDRGNSTGASYLGTLNYAGIGMKQDVAAAECWYTVGQKMNDPNSAYNLGSLYSTAPNHPHDTAKAAGYLRQSAETGYVPAIHSLALLLVHHPELAKSPQESQHLLEYAENAGYWRSSLLLGVLARDGNGMPADPKVAYYHFRVAIRQGDKTAHDLLNFDVNRLTATLGTKQTEAIDADANSWFEQHHLTRAFGWQQEILLGSASARPCGPFTRGSNLLQSGIVRRITNPARCEVYRSRWSTDVSATQYAAPACLHASCSIYRRISPAGRVVRPAGMDGHAPVELSRSALA